MSNVIRLSPAEDSRVLAIESLVEMAIATCVSPETQRSYRTQLKKFLASGHPLNREGVATYLQDMRQAGRGSSSQMSALAAIRKLSLEARVRGLMSSEQFDQVKSVSPGKVYRTRAGVWLTLPQVEEYLALPDRSTYWGKRDASLLSLMVGCGLRRAEMALLRWSHYQSRDGRMCIVDIKGKGNKLRTLPVPVWAQEDTDAWQLASQSPPTELPPGEQFRPMDPAYVLGGLSDEGVYRVVQAYGKRAGHNLAPHDLRRTLAKMLRRSGAPLEQIQYTLGHESISTTTIYLGGSLELERGQASVDKLGLRGGGK